MVFCNLYSSYYFSIDVKPSDLLRSRAYFSGPGPVVDFDEVPEFDQFKFSMRYVNINPELNIFNQQPHLKKAVYLAINRAIEDVNIKYF